MRAPGARRPPWLRRGRARALAAVLGPGVRAWGDPVGLGRTHVVDCRADVAGGGARLRPGQRGEREQGEQALGRILLDARRDGCDFSFCLLLPNKKVNPQGGLLITNCSIYYFLQITGK